jgi:hypothetical protein
MPYLHVLQAQSWTSHLPWVRLGMGAAPKEDSGTSSAKLVLRFPLLLPGELLHVPEAPCVQVPPPPTRQVSYAEATNMKPHLMGAEYVYVRAGGQQRLLAAPFACPSLMMEMGAQVFKVQIGQKVEALSVDCLKLHSRSSPMWPASAATHGQPKKQASCPACNLKLQTGGGGAYVEDQHICGNYT